MKKADLTAIMATIGTFAVIGVVLLAVIGLLVWASNSAGKTQAPPTYPYAEQQQVTEYPIHAAPDYPYAAPAPDPVPTPTPTTPPDDYGDFLVSPFGIR